jgi:hypothetical protein
MALRRIFGSKREEVTGNWRKLHNEELYNFSHCQERGIIRMMESNRMKAVGYEVHMVEKRNAYRFMIGNMKERDHLGDFGING